MDGFIPLTPAIDFDACCPECGTVAKAHDWQLPGLWIMAEFCCPSCGSRFLHDLPYSLGVMIPCCLNLKTGATTSGPARKWYSDALADAWTNRGEKNVAVTVAKRSSGTKACLVNCLYPWWGDAVNLLLRVNQLRGIRDMGVIVLINPALRWMVPGFVDGIWVVEQEVRDNIHWNPALDAKLKTLIREQNLELCIPTTFQPAHLTRDELFQATKIEPFPLDEWHERLQGRPVVTFMWREDRRWNRSPGNRGMMRRIFNRLLPGRARARAIAHQAKLVKVLAHRLREIFPALEFAVCGLGRNGKLPAWVKDERVDAIDKDTNHSWAEQGARSHVVCGVTGSHLTLPGALAGSYIELVPIDYLRNVMTCAPVTSTEPRLAVYLHRLIPTEVSPHYLSELIAGLLMNFGYASVAFRDAYYQPLTMESLEAVQKDLERRRASLTSLDRDAIERLSN